MCGRTACTLAPSTVEAACRNLPVKGVKTTGDTDRYRQSHNTTPHQTTPVLVKQGDELVVHYMRWGLVPSWHKGTAKDFKMNMVNARKEGLGNISSFRKPLEHGQRCVVIAEGFYEWQHTEDGKKQPYYVFFSSDTATPPALAVKAEEGKPDASSTATISGRAPETATSRTLGGKQQRPLLAFAALYDVHQPPRKKQQPQQPQQPQLGRKMMTLHGAVKKEEEEDGEEGHGEKKGSGVGAGGRVKEEVGGGHAHASSPPSELREEKPLYTYSIITVPASNDLRWLHDRMPAVLPTQEAMMAWLDTKSTPLLKALQLLVPYEGLQYYPVSSKVGNIRNTGEECRRRIQLVDKTKPKQNALTRWLVPRKKEAKKSKEPKRATSGHDGDNHDDDGADAHVHLSKAAKLGHKPPPPPPPMTTTTAAAAAAATAASSTSKTGDDDDDDDDAVVIID
ncbi:hypothetical protein PTSG_01652 [Salpingoeca rosetta]|uniref:Embryonic stem cell-specific 5-hydroxymethylcytosine-binding protein n=1 Tax=Salpingoeca rosetta (strain ATCC 50818 / BSB-021) TaxID=946362 RepID=F2TYJ9_SALR5|nr:uncharacterized protein PTSG_01652 [Salpingoeca rosetta]EGD78673.1 hypothetical protein PTSG_01652 [Salpingoeca rosetta]|eukprot:XP_004997630.1 hypothetical protein PTSG_01652 [Salpingoeca rosetta]